MKEKLEKYVVITGANSGIGKAAALKFAAEGYRVIMACRNMEAGNVARHELIANSGNSDVDLMKVDLSSFESIRNFCSAYKANYPRLDILIHNAAYLSHGEKEYKLSADGIELSFAVNTFGPFLMTRLLEEHFAESQDPRILHACTTNIKHFFDPKRIIDFDNLRGEYRDTRPYSVYKMYGDSKMALLLLNFKLAEEYRSRGIKVNALQINRVKISPETLQKMSPLWRTLAKAQNLINPMPAGMAETYFHICTSDEMKDVTGRLINHMRECIQPASNEKGFSQIKNLFGSQSYPSYAADIRNREKIWGLSVELTER
ncbi:NAD(P)-dependent dehydrogenase (short-subunit alcohol dehydrogenase family) [Fontibacillus phaseoli]|uniref:NAD(P)-dependent dehydrogenase (Short-subunit alcohol dehydrogenase family) n=1 Tax=Fontibacillus phaseoli TaxID=1416533 RepID=A0A369B4M5_9BACL|nr:SDR family NAD(P)-dependent oxidoreductase [Fontibacillus phaseoli]RCX16433.1 NAD(P)-dependent dehydrogenase (short-subunit alcohol dehydrogenase family) [Fontibacillus phaseoli]